MHNPGYLTLAQTGELKDRAKKVLEGINQCKLCSSLCLINIISEAGNNDPGSKAT